MSMRDAFVIGKVSVYSAGEQAIMDMSQQLRGQIFIRLLRTCVQCGITPNQLTYLSLGMGIAFCGLFGISPAIALPLLALHVLLDGLDGPLARYTGKASNQGSFTDSTADQLVVAFSTITLMHAGVIGVLPGGLYLFLYTLVVVFAMIRSSLAIPYKWVVRPRFVVYSWFLIEIYVWPGSIDYLLWMFTLLLGVAALSGFSTIRTKL